MTASPKYPGGPGIVDDLLKQMGRTASTAQVCFLWIEAKRTLTKMSKSAMVNEIESHPDPASDAWLVGEIKDAVSLTLTKMPWPPAEIDLLTVHAFVRALETEMDHRRYPLCADNFSPEGYGK